ncbi:exodeoxyribonuclease VII small subunit [Rhodospirillum rubrum]|nr:exodeoxyribonuclease VII small subunit [Rhodospirillum rubrum]MBK1677616.1 exodeoxyribonuclease VII small subunit [Rhodospirillum rubrum]
MRGAVAPRPACRYNPAPLQQPKAVMSDDIKHGVSRGPSGSGADENGIDIASLSFEQALTELESIVRKLEQGTIELDQAVGAYERGVALKRHCEAKLAEARMKVERISLGPDGTVGTAPFDAT